MSKIIEDSSQLATGNALAIAVQTKNPDNAMYDSCKQKLYDRGFYLWIQKN